MVIWQLLRDLQKTGSDTFGKQITNIITRQNTKWSPTKPRPLHCGLCFRLHVHHQPLYNLFPFQPQTSFSTAASAAFVASKSSAILVALSKKSAKASSFKDACLLAASISANLAAARSAGFCNHPSAHRILHISQNLATTTSLWETRLE